MRRIISTMLMIALVLSTMTYALAESNAANNCNEGNFRISVTDKEGNNVEGAQIYLYSFLDQKIVEQGMTDVSGAENLYYLPEGMDNVDSRQYGDYMVYVVKEGFVPMEYNLTKYYIDKQNSSQEERNAADRVNGESIDIILEEESELDTASAQQMNPEQMKVMNKIQKELIKTNQLSKDNPICVLKNEDFIELKQKGVVNQSELNSINNVVPTATSSSLRNQKVPVGTFHVSKQAKLDVALFTSDSLKVEVGMQNTSTGEISCSGSRKRGFETASYYAQFTTTKSAAKKTYYTMADFEEWTSVSYYGLSYKHIGLKQINGGTETGPESSCSTCNAAYNNVTSATYGTIVPISNNSHLALSQFKGSTVSLSTKATISGVFTVSLGVTRITEASAKLDYRPKSGYKLKVYNKDTSIWHCTHAAA